MFEVNQYAFPNWRMNEFDRASNYVAMAEGYKIGAIRLLDSLLDDNIGHDADAVIFPILLRALFEGSKGGCRGGKGAKSLVG